MPVSLEARRRSARWRKTPEVASKLVIHRLLRRPWGGLLSHVFVHVHLFLTSRFPAFDLQGHVFPLKRTRTNSGTPLPPCVAVPYRSPTAGTSIAGPPLAIFCSSWSASGQAAATHGVDSARSRRSFRAIRSQPGVWLIRFRELPAVGRSSAFHRSHCWADAPARKITPQATTQNSSRRQASRAKRILLESRLSEALVLSRSCRPKGLIR